MTPEQKAAADRAFEIIRPLIEKACEGLIGQQVNDRLLEGARAAVMNIRSDLPVLAHRVQFKNSAKNRDAIVPANLYTALLVTGVWVTPDEVNDAVGQYVDWNGVRYQWDDKDEKLRLWPVKPEESISVSFTVGADGKVNAPNAK